MNTIIEFFNYFYVKRTFCLLIASFTMYAYGQNLSNEALHKVMTYKKLMSGSMSVKKENGKYYNLDISMETGTGKTYTYIRTIFELNKN